MESVERSGREGIGPKEDVVAELEQRGRGLANFETIRRDGRSNTHRRLTSLRTNESDARTRLDRKDNTLVLEKNDTLEIHLLLDSSSLGGPVVLRMAAREKEQVSLGTRKRLEKRLDSLGIRVGRLEETELELGGEKVAEDERETSAGRPRAD